MVRALAAAAMLAWAPAAVPATPGSCPTVVVGLDPAEGMSSVASYLGRSAGQTFHARDTLIRSLTVWRVASQPDFGIGMHLYITETDSTGYPLLRRVVLDGPTIVNRDGDGVNPVPFRWEFDPPFALPRRGTYAFFLAQNPCAAYFDLVAVDADTLPDGIIWVSGRSGCDMSSGWAEPIRQADLVYRIEFCETNPTPIHRSTWGRLKIIYR